MIRWYDQKTTSCDDCFFYQPGSFPDGTPYMACRQYGYVLTDTKPATDEACEKHVSRDAYNRQLEAQKTARSMRDLQRINRKK